MPRKSPPPTCSDNDRLILNEWASNPGFETRLAERARMICQLLDGKSASEIARDFGIRSQTVIKWRDRFLAHGINGLHDRPRSGKPPKYGENFTGRLLQALAQQPPFGRSCWNGPMLAKHLDASSDAVWRTLRKLNISLGRQRTWHITTDPRCTIQTTDIIGLYLAPPENALIISANEIPGSQPSNTFLGHVCTCNGSMARSLKKSHERQGTLCLCSALKTAMSTLPTQTNKAERKKQLLPFMDGLLLEYQRSNYTDFHIIIDKCCFLQDYNGWLAHHPNVTIHCASDHLNWIGQIETWFNILFRRDLHENKIYYIHELSNSIKSFIELYTFNCSPFIWKKIEIKNKN